MDAKNCVVRYVSANTAKLRTKSDRNREFGFNVTGFVILVALALLVSGVFVVFFFTAIVNFVIDKVSKFLCLTFLYT